MQTRQVKAGEIFSISVKNNPSTGYVWKYQEVEGLENISTSHQIDNPELIGGSTTITFHFRPKCAGEFPLKIFKIRPWEKSTEPLSTYEEIIYVSQ